MGIYYGLLPRFINWLRGRPQSAGLLTSAAVPTIGSAHRDSEFGKRLAADTRRMFEQYRYTRDTLDAKIRELRELRKPASACPDPNEHLRMPPPRPADNDQRPKRPKFPPVRIIREGRG